MIMPQNKGGNRGRGGVCMYMWKGYFFVESCRKVCW